MFGPKTNAAFTYFQEVTHCGSEGCLTKATFERLLVAKPEDIKTELKVVLTVNTVFKTSPIDSRDLSNDEKFPVAEGEVFDILKWEKVAGHIKVVFRRNSDRDRFKSVTVYIWSLHTQVQNGDERVYPPIKPKSFLLDVPYFSQRDNEFNPGGSCNVTSIAMCLNYLKIPQKKPSLQYEDELYEYALNKGYSRHSPGDLARIVRDYGAEDRFTDRGTIEDVIDWISKGNPCVTHGYFTTFGHIIAIVGYDEKSLIVHDPWGEFMDSSFSYSPGSGESLSYSFDLIRRRCIPDGSFWVHFISD